MTPPAAEPARTPRGILLVVFTTIFLDLVGFGIIIPILPFYAETFGASAAMVTLLGAAYSGMQFLCTPMWGRLSDRIGRKPVLIVSIIIAAVGYLIFGWAGTLWVLFAARILQGLGTANIGTAQAIIADVTPPDRRANGMAIVGVAFGLGFIIGPAIGGVAGQWGIEFPAFVAAALSGINLIFVLFLMPETRPKTAGPSKATEPALALLRRSLTLDQVPRLLFLYFGVGTAFALMEQVLGLFIEHYWLPGDAAGLTHVALDESRAQEAIALTAWLLITVGVTAVIVQGGLVGRLANRFGERPLVILGIFLEAIGVLAMPVIGLSGSFPLLLAGGVVLAIGSGLLSPSLTSLLSVASPDEDQGSILGLGQSLSALGRVLGPAVAGLLFQWWVPLPFYLGGGLLVLCGVVAMGIKRRPTAPTPAPETS
ncbi:MAG: MFS transporter [Myxococcota bacterium]